jgi:lysophospholipase L1-like esterase
MRATITSFIAACFIGLALPANAEPPWVFGDDTRYMALGDSLAAGYGAQPVTQGYVYRLYQRGIFDSTPNTLFANASVPGATSADVLNFQVPQVDLFSPDIITISVGGNDLLTILNDPVCAIDLSCVPGVLAGFATNLTDILASLITTLPDTEIIVGNLYVIPEIPGADLVVPEFNNIVAGVSASLGVKVADVFNAFGGIEGRSGLLLIDRNGAGAFEVHPTNAGYGAMANAFEAAFNAP